MFDNRKNTCCYNYISYLLYLTDLSKATGLSATLIRLDPPKIELNWSYEAEAEDGLEPQHFEVLAQPDHNSSATSIPITKNPSECQAILELTWDTNYTLTVTTTYGNNIKIESEAIKFTSHTENEGLFYYICSIAIVSNKKSYKVEMTFKYFSILIFYKGAQYEPISMYCKLREVGPLYLVFYTYNYIPKLASIMALKLVFLKESAKANTARCKHREYCYEVRVDQKKLTVK